MFSNLYQSLILKKPRLVFLALILITSFFLINTKDFRLDASSETLLIEGDPDFIDRSLIENRFKNAESFMIGKRSYINHFFFLETNNDQNFLVGQELFYETK